MAIQNFLSGGYYGKLGATVGQRWKNKRTIRTYVVPANPRTEIQQANRNKFANAVLYAQMGMQMNYYATCFSDPNFTNWNYRMKTARELKNAGLTGLDLIPLYPFSFVPQLLLSEITKDTVQGQKHITFAIPNLDVATDRVFSLMFSLYDESEHYLGLKLYLGYYYANNPGYLEVDVDDVDEINSHCFVRLVTNDDVDSTTDLIASPTLQVQASSIDIRAFNTEIMETAIDTNGITVTFRELWKGTGTSSVDVMADFVYMGEQVEGWEPDETLELFNNNGYCAVLIPFANAGGWAIPAFPNGSKFRFTISYTGATWEYTANNVNVPYQSTDLTRTFNGTWHFATAADAPIDWYTDFGNASVDEEVTGYLRCSGRFDDTSEVEITVNILAEEDGYIHLGVTGDLAENPMRSGDYLRLAQTDFVVNGVTYRIPAGNLTGINATTTSNYLRSEYIERSFYRDGGSSVGDGLVTLSENYEPVVMDTDPSYSGTRISRVNTVNGHFLTPAYTELERDTYDPTSISLVLTSNFDSQDYYEDVNTGCNIVYASVGNSFVYKGITYLFALAPSTVGGYTL